MVFFSRVALESTLYSAGDEEDLWLLEHVVEGESAQYWYLGCGVLRLVLSVSLFRPKLGLVYTLLEQPFSGRDSCLSALHVRPFEKLKGCPSGRRAVLLPGNFFNLSGFVFG